MAVDIGFETVETNLARAIDFAIDWSGAYLAAGPTLRRQLNQAIFKMLWIDDTHQVTSEFTEPFETLLGEEVTIPAQLRVAEQEGADEDEIDRLWRQLSVEWTASHSRRQLAHAGARNTEPRSGEPLRGLKYETLVDAMERYGNRRQRVERLVSAWNQGVREDADPPGESGDPLIGASAEPSKRPRTRLTDSEVDAMRTARAQGVSVNALARRFGVHRGTVWAKTRPA